MSSANARRAKILGDPEVRSPDRAVVLAAAVTVRVALAVQDRTDRGLTPDIERTQSELLGLGAQITAIKDADLTGANDYIAAYAQIDLQKEYDEKLQKFSDLYTYSRDRDSHRGLLDLQLGAASKILGPGIGCRKSLI